MIDSTVLGAVVGECAAGSAELVVECDRGGEGEQALQDALSEALEGSCSVALEGQGALAGPEDRLDALADRRQVRSWAGLVLAAGPEDRRVELVNGLCECSPGIALVADQRLATRSTGPPEQFQGDVALVAFGGGDGHRPGCAVRREDAVQAKTPEEAAVAAAVAVVGGVAQRGALDGLAASGALHRGGVDQQQIVVEPGALAREHAHQPLQRVGEPTAALEVAGLPRKRREQVAQMLASDPQETPVRGYSHDRLRHAQSDDLRVCDAPSGVLRLLGQEIVSRHINGSEQQVEVGVHRGPLRSAMLQSTADFDPAAPKPSKTTALAVESII